MWNMDSVSQDDKPLLPLQNLTPSHPFPVSHETLKQPFGKLNPTNSRSSLLCPNKSVSFGEITDCRSSSRSLHPLLNNRFQPCEDSKLFLHNISEKHSYENRAILQIPGAATQQYDHIASILQNFTNSQNIFTVEKRKYDAIPFISDTEKDFKNAKTVEEGCAINNLSVSSNNMEVNNKQSTIANGNIPLIKGSHSEDVDVNNKFMSSFNAMADGAKHDLSSNEEGLYNSSKRQRLEVEEKCELQSELERGIACITEPIVGLDYIAEYQKENLKGNSVRLAFRCSLCNSRMFSTNVLEHILGTKHRLKFLRVKDAKKYNEIISFRISQDEITIVAEKCAEELENAYGRGHVEIIFESTSKDSLNGSEDRNFETESCNSTTAAIQPSSVAHSSGASIPVISDVQMLNDILLVAKSLETQSKTVDVIPFLSSEGCDNVKHQADEFDKDRQFLTSKGASCKDGKSQNGRAQAEEELNRYKFLLEVEQPEIETEKLNEPIFSTFNSSTLLSEALPIVAFSKSPTALQNEALPIVTCSGSSTAMQSEAQNLYSIHHLSPRDESPFSSSNIENDSSRETSKSNCSLSALPSVTHDKPVSDIRQDSQLIPLCTETKESEVSMLCNSNSKTICKPEPEILSSSSLMYSVTHAGLQKEEKVLSSSFPSSGSVDEPKDCPEETLFDCLAQCNIETTEEANLIFKVIGVLTEKFLKFQFRQLPGNLCELLIKSLQNGEEKGIQAALSFLDSGKKDLCNSFLQKPSCSNKETEKIQNTIVENKLMTESSVLQMCSEKMLNINEVQSLEKNIDMQRIRKINKSEIVESPSRLKSQCATKTMIESEKVKNINDTEISQVESFHVVEDQSNNAENNSNETPSADLTLKESNNLHIQPRFTNVYHQSPSSIQDIHGTGLYQSFCQTKLIGDETSLPMPPVENSTSASLIASIPIPETASMKMSPYGWPLMPFSQEHQQAMAYMYWASQGLSVSGVIPANTQMPLPQNHEQFFYPLGPTLPNQQLITHPPLPPPPPPPPPPPQFSK